MLAAVILLQLAHRFFLPYPSMLVAAGVALAGLPLATALALGALVAPPDAAAATATLGAMSIPRTTET